MKILLTNDDGIHAQGLHAMAHELASFAEVYVAAPDRERSGTGHSITVFDPIRVVPANIACARGSWVIGGTPVDCVKLAVHRLIDENIDLVVSGINHGPNLGTDVLYSGTVSAAAEGVLLGIPSIAVSLNSHNSEIDCDFAARFTGGFIKQLMKREIERKTLININIPVLQPAAIKGARMTKLGVRNYDNLFEERKDPRGRTYYWMGGGVIEEEQERDSDVRAISEAYISITPIHLDLTDYALIDNYREIFAGFLDKPGDQL